MLALERACGAYGILPTRYPNIGNLRAVVVGDGPNAYGGSADIWRGEVNGCPVAVKVTRRYSTVPMAHSQKVSTHWRGGSMFAHWH